MAGTGTGSPRRLYDVHMSRWLRFTTVVVVEASSDDEARLKALDQAPDLAFSKHCPTEHTVEVVRAVPGPYPEA